MSTQCSQCRMILNEQEKKAHISAQHLSYFPFRCSFCARANKMYSETTEEDILQHIATSHHREVGIDLVRDQDKEVTLNRMMEECQQITSVDSTNSIAPEPHNLTETHMEVDQPSQSALNRKRGFTDNVSANSDESREQRVVMNDEQHLLPASDGVCSREANHNATMSISNDRVERPTTSCQAMLNAPIDSCQNRSVITKLYIVISEGIVCYETEEQRRYNYAPLSDYLPDLAKSEICMNACDVVIQFYACDTGNFNLNDKFLEELYERDELQRSNVILSIPDDKTANDFLAKLKKRFRRNPQKRFMFELLPNFLNSTTKFDGFSLERDNCVLEAKPLKNCLKSVIIEQRAIGKEISTQSKGYAVESPDCQRIVIFRPLMQLSLSVT
ncbi:hypothetical protein Ddc_11887 [Ditylenchus destructor]|nr:hypothetical protein Ddc_11887 [Ditylenchus destructor]